MLLTCNFAGLTLIINVRSVLKILSHQLDLKKTEKIKSEEL